MGLGREEEDGFCHYDSVNKFSFVHDVQFCPRLTLLEISDLLGNWKKLNFFGAARQVLTIEPNKQVDLIRLLTRTARYIQEARNNGLFFNLPVLSE
jgi:hypothetical protein